MKERGRYGCLILLLVLTMIPTLYARGEKELIPGLTTQLRDLTLKPLCLQFSAEVNTRLPFDEKRTEALNLLLNHFALELSWKPAGTDDVNETDLQVSFLGDGLKLFSLQEKVREDECCFRTDLMPNIAWKTSEPQAFLNGEKNSFQPERITDLVPEVEILAWIGEAEDLLHQLPGLLAQRKKITATKGKVGDYGSYVARAEYTISKDESETLEGLGRALADLCPEGKLKAMLSRLTFTGKQKLTLLTREDGSVLKAAYEGKCGPDSENIRNVSLSWKLRRDDEVMADDVTLKTPAVKGNDHLTVTAGRKLCEGKQGTEYTFSMKLDQRSGKEKTVQTEKTTLLAETAGTAFRLTGSTETTETKNAGEKKQLTLTPDLTIGTGNDDLQIEGTLRWQEKQGKRVLNDALLHARTGTADVPAWSENIDVIDYDVLTAEEKEEVKASVMAPAMREILKKMLQLPEEERRFLTDGLTEELLEPVMRLAGK